MINANEAAPFNALLKLGQSVAGIGPQREDDRGAFVHALLCNISEYLEAEEVVDFSLVNRATNRFLSMRSPVMGGHPVLAGESLSPRERGFYEHQAEFTANAAKAEQKKASRMMRRYLPLLNGQDPFSTQKQALRDQYRALRAQLATVNAGMAFLAINSYLSNAEKANERTRLRASFRALRHESIQLEHTVSAVMDQLMDGREPRLELQSDFFRGRRAWR